MKLAKKIVFHKRQRQDPERYSPGCSSPMLDDNDSYWLNISLDSDASSMTDNASRGSLSDCADTVIILD